MVGAVSTLYSDPTYWGSALLLVVALAVLKPVVGWIEAWRLRKSGRRFRESGRAQALAELNSEWDERVVKAYKEFEAEQAVKRTP